MATMTEINNTFQEKRFAFGGSVLPYRILWPENFNESKKYPVILFLHGAGERGSDNKKQLVNGGGFFVRKRKEYPAIVVFPQCSANDWWANGSASYKNGKIELYFDYERAPTTALKLVSKLLDEILKQPYSDNSRIYIGGLSMGAMGTFELVSRRPDTFAAAISICGAGNPEGAKKFAQKVPFWVSHGAKDDIVRPENSVVMVEAIKMEGGDVEFSIYPEVWHNSWDRTFEEPKLLSWLFGHRKEAE